MKKDPFKEIIEKKIPAYIIYEDEKTIAFLDKKPVCEGHTLVVPKKNYKNIFDIPEEELCNIMKTVKKIAELLKDKLGATGVNILHASGSSAQQSVNRLHFHIIPRRENDGLDMWPKVEYKEINLEEVYKRLK